MTSRAAARPALRFVPLTPATWDAFETLFGPRGACGGCWCMWWRLGASAFKAGKGASNRRAMRGEGYPLDINDCDTPAAFAWTGFLPAFERAGFVEVARRSARQPVMRRMLRRAAIRLA